MKKPAPLTPADSDLSDFSFMPLDVGRFRRSDLVTQEEPEAVVAAIHLWGAAWHSKPAASLSNNDRSLAQAAGFGRAVEAFLRVKEAAMRGFVECSDGRLYHPVVAEKALEAWEAKLKRLWRTECARIRKHNERHPDEQLESIGFEQWRLERYSHARQDSNVTRDSEPMSRATGDESHTRQDEDAQNVTRDNSATELDLEPEIQEEPAEDERNPMSHATDPIVTRDIDLDSCARAEKGQGQGQGQGDSNRLRSATSKDGDDEFPVDPDFVTSPGVASQVNGSAPVATAADNPLDPPRMLLDRVNELGMKAGLNLTVPAKLIAATDQLKQWEEAGIDYAATILPTIESRTRENPSEPIFSLKYFDAAVRKAHAVSSVGGKVYRSPEPRAAIDEVDDSDERVAKFRSRLEKAVGGFAYDRHLSPDAVAVKVVDGKFLDVIFRSAAERSLVTQGDLEQHVAGVARSLGLDYRAEVKR